MPGDCARPLKKETLFAELNIHFETAFDPRSVFLREWAARAVWRLVLADRIAEATGNRVEETPLPSIGEKSEVADAHKAARQQVQKEAAQELIDGQGHDHFLLS